MLTIIKHVIYQFFTSQTTQTNLILRMKVLHYERRTFKRSSLTVQFSKIYGIGATRLRKSVNAFSGQFNQKFSLIRGSRSRRKARLHGRTYTGVHDVNRGGMWRRRTVPPTQSLDLPTPPYLSVNLINSIQLDLTGVGPMRLESRRAAYLHSRSSVSPRGTVISCFTRSE